MYAGIYVIYSGSSGGNMEIITHTQVHVGNHDVCSQVWLSMAKDGIG